MTKRSLRFLANDRVVETDRWEGSPALDFIRKDLALTGTKEGCREGDCGACAVLLGERKREGGAAYRAVPSCVLPLAALENKHLVTIEGLAAGADGGLTPVMRAFLEENASQCGFCSPGFIIVLTAWLIEGSHLDEEGALEAVSGNLCRCTGYGSIRRAAARLIKDFRDLPPEPEARLDALAAAQVVPASLPAFAQGGLLEKTAPRPLFTPVGFAVGGGSDLYVRNPDPIPRSGFAYLPADPSLKAITRRGATLEVGAAATVREFFASEDVRSAVPGIERFEGKFASILVRNVATLGGNAVNASPVADIVSMLIALGAIVRIERPEQSGTAREIPLERLYLGYKKLDLAAGELVTAFLLQAHGRPLFNFEKASKRSTLDIAAVNTAIMIELDENRITRGRISAGGVAATPLLLEGASELITGREVTGSLAVEAARAAASEVSPISDVRGSAAYRIEALKRLVLAHFATLFPGDAGIQDAVTKEALR